MPNNLISKITIFDIIKLIVGTLIIYFGLSINVKQIGDDFFDFGSKDFLNTEHNANLRANSKYNEKFHNISDSNFSIDDLCLSNQIVCDKMKFDENLNGAQRYFYTSGSIFISNFISQNLVIGNPLFDVIDNINVVNDLTNRRRGFMKGKNITINTSTIGSDNEYIDLLGHELGHIIDLGVIQGSNKNKDKNFTEFKRAVFSTDDLSLDYYKLSWESENTRKAESKSEDFCSGYGMFNPFEDFAECNNLYLNHNLFFRLFARNNKILTQKYNFIASLYNGKFVSKDSVTFNSIKINAKRRPWDTTRIAESK